MHFDSRALEWDNDPQKHERAKVFAKEINDFIKPAGKLTALEFGCGTGLLSFNLKDVFKHIVLADSSEGMIRVLKAKIAGAGIRNFIPLQLITGSTDSQLPCTDVIYTLMTLHHICDIRGITGRFNASLKPGGYLCIADLVSEDGSFHSGFPGFDGHNGFDRQELEAVLAANGFTVVYYKECFVIEKKSGNNSRQYPLFLMIARKTDA